MLISHRYSQQFQAITGDAGPCRSPDLPLGWPGRGRGAGGKRWVKTPPQFRIKRLSSLENTFVTVISACTDLPSYFLPLPLCLILSAFSPPECTHVARLMFHIFVSCSSYFVSCVLISVIHHIFCSLVPLTYFLLLCLFLFLFYFFFILLFLLSPPPLS